MEMAMSGSSGGGIGFGKSSVMQPTGLSGIQSQSSLTATAKLQPQPITITESQLWDIIHWLEELRKTEEFAREIPETECQGFMKRVYLTFEYLK